jgi:hypothetical protein
MDAMPRNLSRRPARDQGPLAAVLGEGGLSRLIGAVGGGGGGGGSKDPINSEHDNRGPEGSDQDPEGGEQVEPEDIARAIVAVMSEYDVNRRADLVKRLTEIVNASNEANGNDAAQFRMPRPRASDAPPAFRGQPRVGGAQDGRIALDAADRSLAKHDPQLADWLARIKTGGY